MSCGDAASSHGARDGWGGLIEDLASTAEQAMFRAAKRDASDMSSTAAFVAEPLPGPRIACVLCIA